MANEPITQPLLDEAQEFRRNADKERSVALTAIEGVDANIETLEAQLKVLRLRRQRLALIVEASEKVLVTIPGPRNDGTYPYDELPPPNGEADAS